MPLKDLEKSRYGQNLIETAMCFILLGVIVVPIILNMSNKVVANTADEPQNKAVVSAHAMKNTTKKINTFKPKVNNTYNQVASNNYAKRNINASTTVVAQNEPAQTYQQEQQSYVIETSGSNASVSYFD